MTFTWDPIPTLAMAQELYLSQPRGLRFGLSSAVGGHVFIFGPFVSCLGSLRGFWTWFSTHQGLGWHWMTWLLVCPFSSALYGHNLKPIIIKTISTTNIKAKCSLPVSLRAPAGEEVGLRKSSQKVSRQRLLKMSAAQR